MPRLSCKCASELVGYTSAFCVGCGGGAHAPSDEETVELDAENFPALRRERSFLPADASKIRKALLASKQGFRNDDGGSSGRNVLPCFKDAIGDMLRKSNGVEGLILEKATEDDQLRAQHVPFSNRSNHLAR
jgi:hypothetical protein